MIYLQNNIKMKINQKYGYARVSSKSQESNSSIESQKQQLIQNGNEKKAQIEKLTTSRINKRIKYLKFNVLKF